MPEIAPTYSKENEVYNDFIYDFFGEFPPIPFNQTVDFFDSPQDFFPKANLSQLRYWFFKIQNGPEQIHLPSGVGCESKSGTYCAFYKDFPLHPKTEKLMSKEPSTWQKLTLLKNSPALKPSIVLPKPIACAISSFGLMINPSTAEMNFRIFDFHAAYGPLNMNKSSHLAAYLNELGLFNWKHLSTHIIEQLAIQLKTRGNPLEKVVLNYSCLREKPGEDGTFKGQRVAQQREYTDHQTFGLKEVNSIKADQKFQQFLSTLQGEE